MKYNNLTLKKLKQIGSFIKLPYLFDNAAPAEMNKLYVRIHRNSPELTDYEKNAIEFKLQEIIAELSK